MKCEHCRQAINWDDKHWFDPRTELAFCSEQHVILYCFSSGEIVAAEFVEEEKAGHC